MNLYSNLNKRSKKYKNDKEGRRKKKPRGRVVKNTISSKKKEKSKKTSNKQIVFET